MHFLVAVISCPGQDYKDLLAPYLLDTSDINANPDAQFDWYKIGGRWPGKLIVKKEAIANYEKDLKSLISKNKLADEAYEPIDGQLRVDQARLKDIDWDKMKEIKAQDAEKIWELAHSEKVPPVIYFDPLLRNSSSITKEKYIEIRSELSTYAVIAPHGEWFSKEDSDLDWDKGLYENFLIDEDPDCIITLVDCHI